MTPDKTYCKGCRWLQMRDNRETGQREPYCFLADTFHRYLKACPMKTDDCYK